ncbi:unnamed protein product [Effrenium voratum]|uniref:Uncharacterized protein n=1 Tax=Effrenium voratum TaxID=2562239 RepID=A0AA36HTX7_9DINO|nr:unnamed protein product [Effrenium voratum]
MEDPVEECSDAEAAPCTPPVAGRIAALGALSGGREVDEDHELCLEDTLPGEVAPQNLQEALDAELDEDSLPRDLDAEELLEQVEASDASQEGALAPEEWESWSRQEREMWERIRPRHVRREAQQVQSLRLPGAVVTRLMRLHPQLQAKTAEVMEVLNLATVLLLQAVVKAAARGKAPGQRTSFEDVVRINFAKGTSDVRWIMSAAHPTWRLWLQLWATAKGRAEVTAMRLHAARQHAVERLQSAGDLRSAQVRPVPAEPVTWSTQDVKVRAGSVPLAPARVMREVRQATPTRYEPMGCQTSQLLPRRVFALSPTTQADSPEHALYSPSGPSQEALPLPRVVRAGTPVKLLKADVEAGTGGVAAAQAGPAFGQEPTICTELPWPEVPTLPGACHRLLLAWRH